MGLSAAEDLRVSRPAGGGGVVPPSGGPVPKRQVAAECLARGAVLIRCDGRMCRLPSPHDENPNLALNIGWKMNPPINLRLNGTGIRVDLKFGPLQYHCEVPWPAVYAMSVDGEDHLVLWPGDQPGPLPRAGRPTQVCFASVAGEFDPALETPSRGELRLVGDAT